MAAEIRLFPCLTDNYGYLIHDPATGADRLDRRAGSGTCCQGPGARGLDADGYFSSPIITATMSAASPS